MGWLSLGTYLTNLGVTVGPCCYDVENWTKIQKLGPGLEANLGHLTMGPTSQGLGVPESRDTEAWFGRPHGCPVAGNKLGCLEEQKYILSEFRKPEVQNQGDSRATFPPRALGGSFLGSSSF